MLLGIENLKTKSGDIFTRSYYNFDREFKRNQEIRKQIGKGISPGGEMQWVAGIPYDLLRGDPVLREAMAGNQNAVKLILAMYPGCKTCDGNV